MESTGQDQTARRVYDNLSRFLLFWNLVSTGTLYSRLRIHKKLRPFVIGEQSDRRGSYCYADDFVLDSISPPTAPRVLDLGCGFGHTLFRWQKRFGAQCLGITISPIQAEIGSAHARRRGVAQSCTFQVQSFEAGLHGEFDVVLFIESLVHSTDPAETLTAAIACLAPGGTVAVVEDLPRAADEARRSATYGALRTLWGLGPPIDVSDVRRTVSQAGLAVEREVDLTEYVRTRSHKRLQKRKRLLHALRSLAPGRGFRSLVDTFLGGLSLEELYGEGLVRYHVLIARKPP